MLILSYLQINVNYKNAYFIMVLNHYPFILYFTSGKYFANYFQIHIDNYVEKWYIISVRQIQRLINTKANNKNTNVFIEHNGKLDTLSNHARRAGIKPSLAEDRKIKGKSTEDIFKNGRLGKIKKVAQYDKNMNLIKVWDSCMDICNTLGFNMSNLRGCLSGHRNSTHGFIWKYYEKEG